MKCAGKRFLLIIVAAGNEQIVHDSGWHQRRCCFGLAEDTALGGNLESTVGILGRILVLIRFFVMAVGVAMACRGSLVEKMMDPVRR